MLMFLAFELPPDSQIIEINNDGAEVYYAGVISCIGYLPKRYNAPTLTYIFKIPIGAYITYNLIFTQEQKSFSGDQRIHVDRGYRRKHRNIIFDPSISSPFSCEHREGDFKQIYIYMYYNSQTTANVDFLLKFEGTCYS